MEKEKDNKEERTEDKKKYIKQFRRYNVIYRI